MGVIISTEEKEINAQRGSVIFPILHRLIFGKADIPMQIPEHICSKDTQAISNGATTKKQQIRALLPWIKLDLLLFFH